MSTDSIISRESTGQRYEAVLRISEALCTCCEPEDLAKNLADEIGNFLHFDHLSLTVLKENSKEIEYLVWGKGPLPLPDLPMEELPTWHAMASGDPQHTANWDTEDQLDDMKKTGKSTASPRSTTTLPTATTTPG